jgi:transposase-like protein
MVRRADLDDEPRLSGSDRVWRLRDRLSEQDVDGVVASYQGGVPVDRIARQYGINAWSVRKLVQDRGGQLRSDADKTGSADDALF